MNLNLGSHHWTECEFLLKWFFFCHIYSNFHSIFKKFQLFSYIFQKFQILLDSILFWVFFNFCFFYSLPSVLLILSSCSELYFDVWVPMESCVSMRFIVESSKYSNSFFTFWKFHWIFRFYRFILLDRLDFFFLHLENSCRWSRLAKT